MKRWDSNDEKDETDIDSAVPLIDDDQIASWRKRRAQRRLCIIHAGILLLYILVTTIIVRQVTNNKPQCPGDDLIFSPARGHIRYERIAMDNSLDEKNRFKGEPREELHKSWREILKYMNLRVYDQDLVKINRTSIPLNDEKGGYLVTLDVFHELHCLNVIRQQVYREYYPDKHSKAAQLQHADHCIDMLRQVLMCHGDIALQTFDWIDDYRWPWPNFHVDHECRNWDKIMEWSKEHFVPDLRGPIVAHPTLGISWRLGGED